MSWKMTAERAAGRIKRVWTAFALTRMLFSDKRNPWPADGRPGTYMFGKLAFCMSATVFAACLFTVLSGSLVAWGLGMMAVNAVAMWMHFREMAIERFKSYIRKVLDTTNRGKDPYEAAKLKLAVMWPLLELDRRFYGEVTAAVSRTGFLTADVAPCLVYRELVKAGGAR